MRLFITSTNRLIVIDDNFLKNILYIYMIRKSYYLQIIITIAYLEFEHETIKLERPTVNQYKCLMIKVLLLI